MKFNCCSSCIYLQVHLLTELKSVPRSCLCPSLQGIFGVDVGGFPTRIDIIHCDWHTMFSPWYGDVAIQSDSGKMVSYVDTAERDFRHIRVPKLFDNSKNIKIRKFYEQDRREVRVEECPF